jgi:hypothetical protein
MLLASALSIAVFGRLLVGEVTGDRATAAAATAALAILWLWASKGPSHAWLGERRLIAPKAPFGTQRIQLRQICDLAAAGDDWLIVWYRRKPWGGRAYVVRKDLRLADRDAFVKALLAAVERSEGQEAAIRLNTRWA